MITLEQVKKNLKGLSASADEFINEVVAAFKDYEYKGETCIEVDDLQAEVDIEGYGMCSKWVAFADVEDAPLIFFKVMEEGDLDDPNHTLTIVSVE